MLKNIYADCNKSGALMPFQFIKYLVLKTIRNSNLDQ